MQRLISDDQLQAVIEKRRRWRFTDLQLSLMREFGCAPSTAQRAILRGVDQRQLAKAGNSYRLVRPQSRTANLAAADATHHRLIPDRLAMLEILSEQDHWAVSELVREVRKRLGVHDVVARRNFGYARAFGYVEVKDGRWRLSDHCRSLLSNYGRLETAEGYRFATFLSGKPMKRFERWESQRDPDS